MPNDVHDAVTFAETNLVILNKAGGLVTLRYKPAQRAYLVNRTGRDLVLKARQIGLSTAIQAEFFRTVITRTAITATLAHEDATTQKLRRMADRFYAHLPPDSRPARKYSNDRLTTYPELDSEAIIATAGNRHTGRGGSYTHVHGSEIAFWKDAEALMAGLMQGGNPQIVLESTPNGAQGYFYRLCMEALDGNSAWTLHFFPWWIDPEYRLPLSDDEAATAPGYRDDEALLVEQHSLSPEQIKWRRSKQRELKQMFSQEYPEDPYTCFLRSGAGYFGDLLGVFSAGYDAAPDPAHRYVAGLDFGQASDYTVCCVIDATSHQQVDLVRVNQLPWKVMRQHVIAACQRWHVETLCAESNSMGSTNIEALQSELAAAGCATRLRAFDTTNDSKFTVMAQLYDALHEAGLKLLPDPAQVNEFNAFEATQLTSGNWRLSAPAHEHDDTVIAAALANYARQFSGANICFA